MLAGFVAPHAHPAGGRGAWARGTCRWSRPGWGGLSSPCRISQDGIRTDKRTVQLRRTAFSRAGIVSETVPANEVIL